LYVVFKYLNEYKYNVFVFLVYVVEEPCGCDGSEDDLDERCRDERARGEQWQMSSQKPAYSGGVHDMSVPVRVVYT
jgi:hypothetical protein